MTDDDYWSIRREEARKEREKELESIHREVYGWGTEDERREQEQRRWDRLHSLDQQYWDR